MVGAVQGALEGVVRASGIVSAEVTALPPLILCVGLLAVARAGKGESADVAAPSGADAVAVVERAASLIRMVTHSFSAPTVLLRNTSWRKKKKTSGHEKNTNEKGNMRREVPTHARIRAEGGRGTLGRSV